MFDCRHCYLSVESCNAMINYWFKASEKRNEERRQEESAAKRKSALDSLRNAAIDALCRLACLIDFDVDSNSGTLGVFVLRVLQFYTDDHGLSPREGAMQSLRLPFAVKREETIMVSSLLCSVFSTITGIVCSCIKSCNWNA